MVSQTLSLQAVSFAYPSSSTFIFDGLTIQFDRGWTGVIGPNGLGKTTLLRLIAGELEPVQGHIQCSGAVTYCLQRTDDPPEVWRAFMEAKDRSACMWRGRLEVSSDWLDRWSTLSHGQRKRVQVAAALWKPTHILALDEPTNHIDRRGRDMILQALGTFDGIGLMVSHDRRLLDTLCHEMLCMEPAGPIVRPGGYSEAMRLAEADRGQRRSERQRAKHQLANLNREISARARAAGRADKQRSKRKLRRKDHDAKAKRDLARVSGKDGQAGRKRAQLSGRQRHLQHVLDGTFVVKEPRLQLELPSEPYPGDRLLSLPEGTLALGPTLTLSYPDLTILPQDRIGVTGDNGVGKTRLIQWIVGQLAIPPERFVYVPQEISAEQGAEIVRRVRTLPKDQLGVFMTVVGSLGSDPAALLETDCPSPGEMRKLLLACGVVKCPYLIVMDEPTNHLDLPSTEALERALSSCAGALVLVSHDPVFLESLVQTRWTIEEGEARGQERRMQLLC